ncbi:MAG: tRNA dihydrouridine synthase DusB [Eubacteriales bacterium]
MTPSGEKKTTSLWLAPMAGFTDHAFRLICRRFGADFFVTEMISAKALHYKDEKTATLARISHDEGPTAIQIFGSDPEIMAEAAESLSMGSYHGCTSEKLPIAIDVNMGCPMRKIVSNGEGSALMRDPDKIYAIVKSMTNATALPVTVKMRTGWDRDHLNAVECALAAKEGGAKGITVHGRTREQLYAPPVDADTIAAVKRAVGETPVIANGGITCADDAKRMLEITGCDGLMIGQAAIGNPWIFREIRYALSGLPYPQPDLTERIAVAKDHLAILAADKGEYTAVREGRPHLARYAKGLRGGARFRERINHAESISELYLELDKLTDGAAENF